MPELSVVINGRAYAIVCGEGQQDHVTALANDIDRRVQELVSVLGQAGEARLLLMAGLLISDELTEVRATLSAPEQPPQEEAQEVVQQLDLGETDGATADTAEADAAIEQVFNEIDGLAERIEAVAQRLRCI